MTPASTRLTRKFDALREAGELGLVAYITAGDPTLQATGEFVVAMAEAGADVIELGVPFSDPLADGPTIQRASERALRGGATLPGLLALISEIRCETEVPIVLFSYFNPILQMGVEKFAEAASEASVDGVLVTDLPPEEAGPYLAAVRTKGLDTIFLAAPTSSDARLRRIAECSTGFLYVISRTGVTGERETVAEELPALIRRVRSVTALPLAVGFGISLPGHVSLLGGLAEAAVVGSALVAEIEKAGSMQSAKKALAEKVRSLKEPGRKGMSRRSV